jgi:hypothetical protein
MEMSNEYGTNLHASLRAHHLLLCPLTAIEEHHVSFPVNENGRRIAVWSGKRSSSTKKSYGKHELLNCAGDLNRSLILSWLRKKSYTSPLPFHFAES